MNFTHLSLSTTPSIQAPNRTTQDMSVESMSGNALQEIINYQPSHLFIFPHCSFRKDTHSRGGRDGSNRANGDRLLGVAQVSRAVRARHDTCGHECCSRLDLLKWYFKRCRVVSQECFKTTYKCQDSSVRCVFVPLLLYL